MKEYVLLDRKYWKAILHPDQYYLGRSVILSKTNHEHFSEFSLEEMKELFEVIKDLEESMIKLFDATHFNWTCLNNDSYKEKNRDKERLVHLHVRPRYSHPVVLKGYTFLDRNFGHHYERKTDEQVTDEIMTFITDSINKEIKIKS
jgi:diadenosine tetraphosphate (Ap4A) HIT family hydrolase